MSLPLPRTLAQGDPRHLLGASIRHGSEPRRLRSFVKEGRTLRSYPMTAPMARRIRFLPSSKQFDAAFGGEQFDEASKLPHVSMYLQKSGRKWWSKLQMTRQAPKTWKACCKAIMKQFLTSHAQDDVIAEWHGLHMEKGESIKKYIDRFWDLHLKACVF